MARTRKEMTFRDVDRAVIDAQVPGREYEVSDVQVPGLDLRVRGRTAVWYLRGRLGSAQPKWRIGGAATIGIVEARKRALAAKLKLKAGQDPRDWLLEIETGEQVRHHDPKKDGWTWEEGRDEFLEFTKQQRRPDTYKDYRRTLYSPVSKDLKPFEGKLLKHITETDVMRLQDTIGKRAALQARHTVTIVRRCLAFCAGKGDSGIRDNVASHVKSERLASDMDASDKLGRLPSIDELSNLFWQMAHGGNPAARLAGCLIVLTGQRIATVRRARVQDFKVAADGRSGLWDIPRPFMKAHDGRRYSHVIPLPPVTWHVVQQAIALLPTGSVWLFPQARERRAGSGEGGTMAHNTVREALASGGSKVGPHDNRRAFGTYGEKILGNTPVETKLILDHGASDVTARYTLHDGTHITWSIMRRWEDWLMNLCAEKQPPNTSQAAPPFLVPPGGSPTAAVTVRERGVRLVVANTP